MYQYLYGAKKDDGKYYVMTPSEITDDIGKQAATKYAEFMNTQVYKDYTTAYDKFIKKNPDMKTDCGKI